MMHGFNEFDMSVGWTGSVGSMAATRGHAPSFGGQPGMANSASDEWADAKADAMKVARGNGTRGSTVGSTHSEVVAG